MRPPRWILGSHRRVAIFSLRHVVVSSQQLAVLATPRWAVSCATACVLIDGLLVITTPLLPSYTVQDVSMTDLYLLCRVVLQSLGLQLLGSCLPQHTAIVAKLAWRKQRYLNLCHCRAALPCAFDLLQPYVVIFVLKHCWRHSSRVVVELPL